MSMSCIDVYVLYTHPLPVVEALVENAFERLNSHDSKYQPENQDHHKHITDGR